MVKEMKKRKLHLLLTTCCIVTIFTVGCGKSTNTKPDTNVVQQESMKETNQKTDGLLTEKKKDNNEKSDEVKKESANKVEDNKENESKGEEKAEKHTIEGTIGTKKDFMFVLEDGDKGPYDFAFSEKPEGYDELKVGDKVIVEYTGDISTTEAFTGEVISVKKVD